MIIVLFFYLLDSPAAERKDRSILFWKSLPVSDTQVVLSKLLIALVVVPLGVFVLLGAHQVLFADRLVDALQRLGPRRRLMAWDWRRPGCKLQASFLLLTSRRRSSGTLPIAGLPAAGVGVGAPERVPLGGAAAGGDPGNREA